MATSSDRQRAALQTIFAFFLGLMVLALIGVGVNTFYPSPAETLAIQAKRNNLQLQMDSISRSAGKNGELTQAQQAQMNSLQTQMNALDLSVQAEMQTWTLYTSIIIIVFATIVMVISLVLSEHLRVLSNGVLLGGLFTMIYGIGFAAFGGVSSIGRFFVIVFAVIVTVALGYTKFVRGRKTAEVPAGAEAGGEAVAPAALGGLEARVSRLEVALGAMARALGADVEEPPPAPPVAP
jgi:hypothetical protein